MLNVAWGFHLFILRIVLIGQITNRQKKFHVEQLSVTERVVQTFYTENTVFSKQNHFINYKHISEGRNTVLKNFPCSENVQVRKKAAVSIRKSIATLGNKST